MGAAATAARPRSSTGESVVCGIIGGRWNVVGVVMGRYMRGSKRPWHCEEKSEVRKKRKRR